MQLIETDNSPYTIAREEILSRVNTIDSDTVRLRRERQQQVAVVADLDAQIRRNNERRDSYQVVLEAIDHWRVSTR